MFLTELWLLGLLNIKYYPPYSYQDMNTKKYMGNIVWKECEKYSITFSWGTFKKITEWVNLIKVSPGEFKWVDLHQT